MCLMEELQNYVGAELGAHNRRSGDFLAELRQLTTKVSFGYSPLRRIIVYEIYRFLLGVNGQPHVRDFFEKLEIYPFHRDRLAARFSELDNILVPIPESREEIELQLLSLDEDVFHLPEKEYKGAVYTEIDAKSYPKFIKNQGYDVNYTARTVQGQLIQIDSTIALIDSHKGDGKRLIVFALPEEKCSDFRAVFAVWKDFYKMLSPLKEPEDIFLAIYEYYHYSSSWFQSFVDNHALIEEYALELSFVASFILKKRSFALSKESVVAFMRGRWSSFHGSQMLVDDYFFNVSTRLGYLRSFQNAFGDCTPCSAEIMNWETFPTRCELHFLGVLAERNGISISKLQE